MAPQRRRILLAVDPFVLAGALAGLLEQADQDDVVVIDLREGAGGGAGPGTGAAEGISGAPGHFDAAVVTRQAIDTVDADVIIELPDDRGGPGTATVHHSDRHDRAPIEGVIDLVALLDETCAAAHARVPRLRPEG